MSLVTTYFQTDEMLIAIFYFSSSSSSITSYVGSINGKQEVMVGYSDSAKDAGRLAACWAQYTAQEAMAKVADKYGIELTFFHGKVSN